jgi:hypothetical protein
MKKSLLLDKAIYVAVGLLFVASLVLTGCSSDAPVDEGAPILEEVEELDPAPESTVEDTPVSEPIVEPVTEPVVEEVAAPVVESTPEPVVVAEPEPAPEPESTSKYVDGSYFQVADYSNPAGSDSITVQLQITDDKIQHVAIGLFGNHSTSEKMQQLFADGIGAVVIGKSLDEVGSLGAVNGSSLTPKAFNSAVQVIKGEAAA